jgi:RHS repeat-associated protein
VRAEIICATSDYLKPVPFYGLGLVSQVSAAGASSYYDFDGSGNTVGITGASGTYVNQYSYLPFGETTTVKAALANPFTFEGETGVLSDGSGLVLMRARAYLPATGQFTTADPTGLAGGSVNLRAYAANDPVSIADPSGLSCQSDIQNKLNQLYDQQFELAAQASRLAAQLDKIQNGSLKTDALALQYQFSYYGAVGESFAQAHPNAAAFLASPASYQANLQAKLAQAQSQLDDVNNQIAQLQKQQANCPKNPGPNKPKLPKFAYCTVPVPPKKTVTPNSLGFQPDDDTTGGMSGCGGAGSGGGENAGSDDPNDIIGPAGYGAQGFVPSGQSLPYTIQFTNDSTASAPAQVVTVTESLSSSLDWTTFQLGSFGFGGITVSVPPGRTSFSTQVDDRAANGVYVDVSAAFNPQTGVVTWTFTAIDPTTLDQPANPLEGFLPPDQTSPEGEGFVNYTVQPKASDPTGTVLSASASVVFDNNAPVVTTPITNTIDAVAPTSTVAALPADVLTNFPVSWSGTDDPHGSGIASYNVFASEDGGPFVLWQAGTTVTTATFNGEAGNTYAFYSVATSGAGNVQSLPAAAQATTTAVAPATLAFSTSLYQVNENAGFASVTVTRSGNLSTTATVDFTTGGGTAVPGVQYTPVSTALSFAPGVTSQVVEIPIHDNLVHGGDLFVDMALSAPSAAGELGSVSSAMLDIHQNDPALVTVLKVSIQKETVKKHKKETVIVLQFSGALNASDAQNRLLFSLAPETVTKKHVIKLGKPVAPASAVFNASTNTVTLTPKKALVLNPPEQLTIISSGLLDTLGRALDGNDDGLPGGNFVATLSKQGITTARLTAAAVDHVLDEE